MLYHPACNPLVVQHMQDLAEKVWAWLHIKDFTDMLRSLVYASHSANIPSFDTTDRETPPTKQVSSAHT
jgi:hypothetical protein